MNVYVYSSVWSFSGVAQLYTGTTPYATSLDCNSVPDSSTNLTVYFLASSLYCHVYVAGHVTGDCTAKFQSVNVYTVETDWPVCGTSGSTIPDPYNTSSYVVDVHSPFVFL